MGFVLQNSLLVLGKLVLSFFVDEQALFYVVFDYHNDHGI